MRPILDIAGKDLLQLLRDRKIFLFLLIMPILFTFFIGFASGGFSKAGDPRLPVGYIDADGTWLSRALHEQLVNSEVIRLQEFNSTDLPAMQARIADEKLAAAIIVPKGYSKQMLEGKPARLVLIGDTGTSVGTSVKSEALTVAIRLESAVRTAVIMERVAGDQNPFDYTFEQALSRWKEPPIRVKETTSAVIELEATGNKALANTSPGMMLQFAIAGLLTSAVIIVSERKSRCLQRMLTTATRRVHILLGHFLAIFSMVFCQFIILLVFGQFILKGELPEVAAGNPAGGAGSGVVYRRAGIADRDAGAHGGAGNHLRAGADVPAGSARRGMDAPGSDGSHFRRHRALFPRRLGDGRLQECVHPWAGCRGGAVARVCFVGICALVLCYCRLEVPGEPGTLAFLLCEAVVVFHWQVRQLHRDLRLICIL